MEENTSDDVATQTNSTVTLHKVQCEGYNPFDHRNLAHPTSTLGSFFHLLKSSLGSGLLAMPAAFKHAGLVPGCIGTVIVGFIATHCVHILVTTSRDVCKESHLPSLNYTDTCESVFKHGPKPLRKYSTLVRHFVDYAMAGVCLGGTSVYVIFIASSIKDLCDNTMERNYSEEIYCLFLLLPLVLITQVRYLKFLVPFSILANLCLVITFGVTCYYTFSGIPNNIAKAKLTVGVDQWPMFISTAIFAMEGINVVMPIENEMAEPKHFLGCPGVLTVTMIFVAILYGVVGFFGYAKYGDNVLGSITLNLPQNETPAVIAKILVVVAVFFTYCLQMYAPMDIIWSRLRGNLKQKFHNVAQILLRTSSVIFTVILAIAVPNLELLIGLVGAIFFSTLGLLIPAVIQTVHKWDRGLGKYSYILWKNGLLLLIYLLVLFSGCYVAVAEIIAKFR